MATHWLKTWPEYFWAIDRKEKTFELRRNDRDFQRGDLLILEEYNPKTEQYSGISRAVYVQYIIYGPAFGLEDGYCCMGLHFPEEYAFRHLGAHSQLAGRKE